MPSPVRSVTTLHELLAPLALMAHAASPEQQQVLSEGMLARFMGRPVPLAARQDPVWSDLEAFWASGALQAERRPHARQLAREVPFLYYLMPGDAETWEGPQLLEVPVQLGGEAVRLRGWTILQEEDIYLSVRATAYVEVGEAVPPVLRAFQGLCLLGDTPEEAQKLCETWPTRLLWAAVKETYRRRHQLAQPWRYVRGMLRHQQEAAERFKQKRRALEQAVKEPVDAPAA